MRELVTDGDGIERFKQNRVISYLLKFGIIDLNDLFSMYQIGLFERLEMEELYQLIGYSVSGYYEIWGEEVEDEW
jgi:hypothetical protein